MRTVQKKANGRGGARGGGGGRGGVVGAGDAGLGRGGGKGGGQILCWFKITQKVRNEHLVFKSN